MSGAVSVPLTFAAFFWQGTPQKWFAILAVVGLWIVIIQTINKNRRERQQMAIVYQDEIASLKKTIISLRAPSFDVEGVPMDITTGRKYSCRLRVSNNNATKQATDVRVELLALTDSLDAKHGPHFRPEFPFLLKPEGTGSDSINPGASQDYSLFSVTMMEGFHREEGKSEMIGHRNFVACFIEGKIDKATTQFTWMQHYRLKIRVTARNFPKTEKELCLTFSNEGPFCRFTVTNVAAANVIV